MATHMSFTEFGNRVMHAILWRTLLDLIIFHQQFANLILEDTDFFIITLIDNPCIQILFSLLKILFVFGIYRSKKGKT